MMRPSPAKGCKALGAIGRAPQLRLLLSLVLGSAAVLVVFTLTLKLPRHTLLLEEELADLLGAHREACCPCQTGIDGAPQYCRLGLPTADVGSAASDGAGEAGGAEEAAGHAGEAAAGEAESGAAAGAAAAAGSEGAANGGGDGGASAHRLAVLIPYRDREAHLGTLLAALRPHLERQGRAHDVFIVEQSDGYLFNRGALLNAAALLLQGSAYDYYAFQDVDTVPLEKGGIQYSFPTGKAPLHLTPHWLHPKSTYEDFFGGLLVITADQFRRVNGFGTQFWGWGREDDNLRERLVAAGMWPPQYPVPAAQAGRLSKRRYFSHQAHEQAAELRAAEDEGGTVRYFQENPRLPYRGAKIMSSQPQFLRDFATGLNTTMFRVLSMQPHLNATRLSLQLHCNTSSTPWCEPAAIGRRVAPAIRHAAAVHAVVGS